jgi:rubrerythrin
MISGREGLQEAMIEAFSFEKGMREFYRHAEANSTSQEARSTFGKLREWEFHHMEYIEFLYQALMGDREFQSYELFMERAPSDHVESGIPRRKAEDLFERKKPSSEMEIINFALDMEGKAYNFYRRYSESAEDTNAQAVYSEMMEQEKKHIEALRKLKKSLGT